MPKKNKCYDENSTVNHTHVEITKLNTRNFTFLIFRCELDSQDILPNLRNCIL